MTTLVSSVTVKTTWWALPPPPRFAVPVSVNVVPGAIGRNLLVTLMEFSENRSTDEVLLGGLIARRVDMMARAFGRDRADSTASPDARERTTARTYAL